MIKKWVSRLSRLTRQSLYIGGYSIYDDTDNRSGPPVLSFLIDYIYEHTPTHTIYLPPLYIENGGTGGTGVSPTLIGLKQVYRAIKTRRELYRFFTLNFLGGMGVFQ